MQAHENRIRQLLDSNKQFIVPLFQRFYVWNNKYWETLWDDLISLSQDDDPKRSHFLGSVVVIPAADDTPSLPKFVLIDGQQRIATLLVLLAATRDYARQIDTEASKKLATQIDETFLTNRFESENDYYKLLLSQSDRVAFQHLIKSKTPCPEPEHSLCKCYDFYTKKLNNIDEPSVSDLFNATVNLLTVVTITLAAHDNPYMVFESLNFKGHKLTEADLIRNYLFMKIPSDQQEELYEKYWLPMQTALGDNLTDYIRDYLIRFGTFVKKDSVYITLKKLLEKGKTQDTLQDLARFAQYYAKLLKPDQESQHLLSAALAKINRLEITTLYPFLLNVYNDYAKQTLTVGTFLEILRLLENYLVRRFVCGAPTSELNKIFPILYSQTQQSENNTDFFSTLKRVLQTKNYPSDTKFRACLPTLKLYGKGGLERKCKFLLEMLERSYQHHEQVTFDSLTIEHVMPQTLNDEWREHLGSDWATIHDLYLHTIGNLTLTGDNSGLSNSSFTSKRNRFAQSHLELNKHFLVITEWQKGSIEQRAKLLTEQALECWPYFGDATETMIHYDNVTGTTPDSVTILDVSKSVKTWREVLIITMDTLCAKHPDSFQLLLDQYPRYIVTSSQKFRRAVKLSNGCFIETHLPAATIHRLCQQVVLTMKLPANVWKVNFS